MPLRDQVTALLNDVTLSLVMPRFRALETEQVVSKATHADPEDVVTIVDHEVEARLEQDLVALLPGSVVIGEEAAAKSPDVLSRLSGPAPVWVIDPLDGTKNFVRGDENFGTIVALVENGVCMAGWIVLPARGQVFSATRGGGATLGDKPLVVARRGREGLLTGKVYSRFMPEDLLQDLKQRTAGRYTRHPHASCAAVEYTDTIAGEQDFVIYYRLLPWDHAAGALMLTEAGGIVRHLTGEPYGPLSSDQVTILARTAAIADEVRSWFA